MSKKPQSFDSRMVQMTLPMSSLPSGSLEAGSLRTFETVKEALGHALRNCGISRDLVAEELTRLTGHEVSVHQINNWAAQGKEDRSIPLHQLAALIAVTGDADLARAALDCTGFIVLSPDQAAYYELGLMVAEDKKRMKERKAIWEKISL